MIVVDRSALLAVLFDEPERSAFQAIIDGADRCMMSAVNAQETACVLRGKIGAAAVVQFRRWLADNDVEIVPFDGAQVRTAAKAFDRFGKGLHPARLNLADCAAYALARPLDAPLLSRQRLHPNGSRRRRPRVDKTRQGRPFDHSSRCASIVARRRRSAHPSVIASGAKQPRGRGWTSAGGARCRPWVASPSARKDGSGWNSRTR